MSRCALSSSGRTTRRRNTTAIFKFVSTFFLPLLLFIASPKSVAAFFPSGSAPRIPTTNAVRDQQAIDSIKKAIQDGKKLIECEFPPLSQLNKLGDGSRQSMQLVQDANMKFANKLAKSVAFPPLIGPTVCLMTSNSAGRLPSVYSLRDGPPTFLTPKDVAILVEPTSPLDYKTAQTLTCPVIIINGIAKTRDSVPRSSSSTVMAYYCKPLTYNSMIAGYLLRSYPSDWTVVTTKKTLGTFTDDEILVSGTNTPDLRGSVRMVQKATDEETISRRRSG